MFEGFADVWTPVELARRLGRRPRRVRLAGERLVLFKDGTGRVGALVDRCPHRGVALSRGRMRQGCLECPGHGWRFGADGACLATPFNATTEARRAHLSATALPVREAAGLVWVYTRPGAEPAEEPALPEPLLREGLVRWEGTSLWRTHWTRAMENSLDFTHLPFVHRRSIGRRFRRLADAGAVMTLSTQPTATGMRVHCELAGAEQMPDWLEFVRPNGMRLLVPDGRGQMYLHLWCVPVDGKHTLLVVATARPAGRMLPLRWLDRLFNRLILSEDRTVTESSVPLEVPHPTEEVHVATDAPTLAFRRYYREVLQRSSTAEAYPATLGQLEA